jgi:hypothetical protein
MNLTVGLDVGFIGVFMQFRDSLSAQFSNRPQEEIQTTIGDLVEALTQVAIEAGNSEKEGYHLASLALADLMQQRARAKRVRELTEA